MKNTRGTLSMARTNDINSATSQFFVNLKDNDFLDHSRGNFGYAVFAHVTQGMDVIDKIAAVETGRKRGFDDVPVEAVIMKSVRPAPCLTRAWPKSAQSFAPTRPVRFCGWLVISVAASVLCVLVLRWIDPPFTAFMAEAQIDGLGEPRSEPTWCVIVGWIWTGSRRICRWRSSPRRIRSFPSTGVSTSRPSKKPTN